MNKKPSSKNTDKDLLFDWRTFAMKRRNFAIFLALLAFGFFALMPQTARAVGTASGTSIDNSATVDFEVGTIAQTQLDSNTASFLVDNMVDLTVATTDVAAVAAVPGSADNVLTYTVTNDGNTVQDYSLTSPVAVGAIFGVTDNFDATNVEIYVDANSNGTYEVVTDVGLYIDELAADASVSVFILGDTPLARGDGDGAMYDLFAQTAVGGTAATQGADIVADDAGAADNPAVVQIVFADGAGTADAANDGQHSSRDIYEVVTASLSVVKSEAVILDPINGAVNPKNIPGATIRYSITVTNSGSDDADLVVLVDAIPGNCTYVAASITMDTVGKTDADDGDEADYNVSTAGAVTINAGTIASGGGDIDITFDVTVD
jgi:uncharacterized repeat protein (TIGR01451 family)